MSGPLELLVVVPVLGRPDRARPLLASFIATRTPDVDSGLLFVCSPGDTEQIAACRAAAADGSGRVFAVTAPFERAPGDFARKINWAYREHVATPGVEFLFQAADDVAFDHHWDREALAVARSTDVGVIGTNDAANPTVVAGLHSTHSLIRASYVAECGASADGPGFVFHEGYGHQYVDNELVTLARARDCWAFAHNSVVRHSHPIFNRRVLMDDTYRTGQATAEADRRLFLQRSRTWKRP